MRKSLIILMSLALLFTLPLSAAAKKKHDHSHGHGDAHADMIHVGEQIVDGVLGDVHLNDVREQMKKMGMSATHHIMIMFEEHPGGKAITQGQAAVKITDPAGNTGNPVRLVAMDGHFGADVVMDKKGEYAFEFGTRLPDGKTRQYEFKYNVK